MQLINHPPNNRKSADVSVVINKHNAFPLEYLMICNELKIKLRTGENRGKAETQEGGE
jgi:hypothetical protein